MITFICFCDTYIENRRIFTTTITNINLYHHNYTSCCQCSIFKAKVIVYHHLFLLPIRLLILIFLLINVIITATNTINLWQ